jgi:CIC family chloride channel protein
MTRLLGGKIFYLIVLAAVIGVGGGYGAILFRLLIGWVNAVAYPAGITVDALFALPWWLLLLVPAAGGLIVGPLIYFFAREAKGHGVPEVMEAVATRGGRIRRRVAAVKILASAISIGVGGAVGREGPIVQIGSSLGSTLGQLLHLDARELRLLVGCGAAAGIAATFNAPIAGAIFALEVILGTGTVSTFTPLVVASVVSTAVSRYHLGDFPAFEVHPYALVNFWELGLYLLLGVLAAFVGLAFSRGLYKVEDLWDKLPVHEAVKPALGGAAVGALALVFPHVMGVGYESIEGVLASDTSMGFTLLLGLVIAKILATHMSLGAGLSGGIFAPSLFIGAMFGGAFGIAVNALLPPGSVAPSGAYAMVAMGAVVSAAIHAPLSAILIVFEMTGDYRIILPLMLACFISSVLSKRISPESIYTLKLIRRGSRLAHLGRDEIMETTSVQNLVRPSCTTATPDTPFSHLVDAAVDRGCTSIYVTDDQGLLRGAIVLEDLSSVIRDEEVVGHLLVAADVMRPAPATTRPDESLARTLRRLGHQGLEELPVVDEHGHLLGVINHSDIIALYDREVLRLDAEAMTFVDDAEPHGPAGVLHVAKGEHVEDIPVTERFAGQSLRQLNLRARFDVHVLGVRVEGEDVRVPDAREPLEIGEVLVVTGPPQRIRDVRRLAGLES